jgi:hypothetical protein
MPPLPPQSGKVWKANLMPVWMRSLALFAVVTDAN